MRISTNQQQSRGDNSPVSRALTRYLRMLLISLFAAFSLVGAVAQANHTWQIDVINSGSGDDVGGYAALVIDSAGNQHAAYYNFTHRSLLYSFRGKNDAKWATTQVDGHGAGTYVSLAVDSSAQPHLAYNSLYEDGLHYATWDGHRWKRQIIDAEHVNYYTSIQLDAQGHPRISYYLYHAPDKSYLLHLKFASFNGRDWTIETVDKRTETGKFNSVAIDASGNPHIAYSHVSLGDLLYASWDGSEWNYGDVDSRRTHNDYVGIGNSIALDHAGNPHIAYFDSTKNTVKYAWMEDGHWKNEVVAGLVGRGEVDHVSLQLDRHDRPHLAYYDGGSQSLKYGFRDDKGWHVEVVDNDGNVGKYPSLCLDANDQPFIAYYALDDGALRMAHLHAAPIATVAEKR
jgi:hypothetical protein